MSIFEQKVAARLPPKNSPNRASVIRSIHSGVIGLSGLIRSSPYDIPVWMPTAVVSVARCVGSPAPIGDAARRCVDEFWRTHRDGWEVRVLAKLRNSEC